MQLAALQVPVLWLLVVLVVLPVAAGTQLPGHSLVAQHEAWGTCTLLLSFPGVCIWERPCRFPRTHEVPRWCWAPRGGQRQPGAPGSFVEWEKGEGLWG